MLYLWKIELLTKKPVKKLIFFLKSGEANYHFLHTRVTLNFMLAVQIEGKHIFCKSPVH